MDRVRKGILLGAIMATLYSLWVLALYLVRGASPFANMNVTVGGVVLTYYITGIGAGALIGALAPIVRSRLGAILLGWLGGFFVVLGVSIAMYGFFTKWDVSTWLGCVFIGLLLGVVGANVFWTPNSVG